ncbi:MAG: cupin domain-containing protein [Burkholderiales bacterium]
MADNERDRLREREPAVETYYDMHIRSRREFHERQRNGPIVIKSSDREYQQTRQGRLFYFLNSQAYKETPLHDWRVFVHDVKTHSGKHRHQGGFIIYVIEGRGYSVVDGERVDWSKGDLLLLPIRPGGVEHQHFNLDEGKGCRWIAFSYQPVSIHVASEITQIKESPQFTG